MKPGSLLLSVSRTVPHSSLAGLASGVTPSHHLSKRVPSIQLTSSGGNYVKITIITLILSEANVTEKNITVIKIKATAPSSTLLRGLGTPRLGSVSPGTPSTGQDLRDSGPLRSQKSPPDPQGPPSLSQAAQTLKPTSVPLRPDLPLLTMAGKGRKRNCGSTPSSPEPKEGRTLKASLRKRKGKS